MYIEVAEKLDLLNATVRDAFPETRLDFRLSRDGETFEGFIDVGAVVHLACAEISGSSNAGRFLDLLRQRVLEADYSIIELVMENIRTVSKAKK